MHRKYYWLLMACFVLLSSLVATVRAGDELLESDWLELVKGFRGDVIGATVVEIEDGNAAGPRTVTLAIPKTALSHPNVIEEVVVTAQMPKKPEPLDISYEWLSDYDNDNYGLVIRLSKDTKWPIRLYMSSDAGFAR